MTHDLAVAERSPAGPVTAPRRRGPTRSVTAALALLLLLAGVGLVRVISAGDAGAALPADTAAFAVWDHEADRIAFSRSLEVGESFMLEHVHSVTQRTVRETFSVADSSTLALEELWYDAFGPNLPTGPETVGDRTTTFIEEDGAYRVVHDGYRIGSVPLLVGGPSVDHTLVFSDGERVRLLDIARAQQRVELFAGSERP